MVIKRDSIWKFRPDYVCYEQFVHELKELESTTHHMTEVYNIMTGIHEDWYKGAELYDWYDTLVSNYIWVDYDDEPKDGSYQLEGTGIVFFFIDGMLVKTIHNYFIIDVCTYRLTEAYKTMTEMDEDWYSSGTPSEWEDTGFWSFDPERIVNSKDIHGDIYSKFFILHGNYSLKNSDIVCRFHLGELILTRHRKYITSSPYIFENAIDAPAIYTSFLLPLLF